MRRGVALVLLLCLSPAEGAAQRLERLELKWDNDILALRGAGAPPDHDYTQGLSLAARVHLTAPSAKHRELRLALGQRIYTPRQDAPEPVTGERPYAGWLFGAASYRRVRPGREEEVGLELGVTGPAALAEPVQNGVHRLLGSEPQRGWANQLGFEPAFALRSRISFPTTASGATLRPYGEAAVGTLWSGAAAGASARVGAGEGADGRGFHAAASLRQEWVGRNLVLAGNTFAPSVRTRARRWVTEGAVAAGYRRGAWAGEYRYVLRSVEYEAQPTPHGYGSLVLRWYPPDPEPSAGKEPT